MIISVTWALYWQLTWFRSRCWRERNWWDWLLSIKTQIICSRVLLSNCRWNSSFNMMNPKTQSSTMIDFSDSRGQYHFVSGDTNAFHVSEEKPSHMSQQTGNPPCQGGSGQSGASTQGSHRSSGIRGEAGRCDKAACCHQTFQTSIAILQKDQKVWGGVLRHYFSCDKPTWSCHGSCKRVYT